MRVQESIEALIQKERPELRRNSASTASLLIGIASLLLPPLGILGIVLGFVGRRQVHQGVYRATARLEADLGLILSTIATIILPFWLMRVIFD